jgi:argininosuccinate lyase
LHLRDRHVTRTVDELRAEHPAFDVSVASALDPETAIERRSLYGGPARAQVGAQIGALRERLEARGTNIDASAAAGGVSLPPSAGR